MNGSDPETGRADNGECWVIVVLNRDLEVQNDSSPDRVTVVDQRAPAARLSLGADTHRGQVLCHERRFPRAL